MGAVRKQQNVSSRTDVDWRVPKAQKSFAGFIFFCSYSTIPDLDRNIFGLSAKYESTVRAIRKGMPLFMFNYSNRYLHGVFEAASDGGFNIDPYAWESTGKYGRPAVSRFPAQVRVCIREEKSHLHEEIFRPVLDDVDGNRFKLELTTHQVQHLLRLFDSSLSLEEEGLVGPNERNQRIPYRRLRDPESPTSTYKSDCDYYSDCSSRGINSGEDDSPDELVGDKLHYHREDEEGQFSGSLRHVSLTDCQMYDRGHCKFSATEEEESSLCRCNVEDTMCKGSFEATFHHSAYDYDRQAVLRFQENDPAVNSDSSKCMQNTVDHGGLPCIADNALSMPVVSSRMQLSYTVKENTTLMPGQRAQCHRRESATSGQVEGKWNNQRRSSRGSPINPQKQSFNQHRSKDARCQKQQMDLDTQLSAYLQPQKLQANQDMLPFSAQGSGQIRDQSHVATVLPSMVVPSNGALAYAQVQTGGRSDESGQGFEVASDGQTLPERWPCQMLLVRPVRPRPSPLSLHSEIINFGRCTRPSSEIQLHVEAAIDCVRRGVKMVWPEADVEVFGSFATGLCLQHSDVDLAVVDAPRVPGSESLTIAQVSATLIRELASGLKAHEWCESINPLHTASMPVLKCLCRPSRASSSTTPAIAVDITIGGTRNSYANCPTPQAKETAGQAPRPGRFISRHTGGAAREYVLQKIRELPALAPLVLLLKSFLHHKGLSNVYTGGLGSFSLTLLVAFYLERVEGSVDARANDIPTSPISPSLSCSSEFSDDSDAPSSSSSFGATTSSDCGGQSMGEFYVRRAAGTVERVLSFWNQNGSIQLGALLIGFLYSFGYRDLSSDKIVLKGTDGSAGGFFKRDDKHVALWIDDPLRPGINIGAGSFCMVHVQTAFKEMLEVLRRPDALMSLQCEDKCCQDLAAMGYSDNLRRLIMESEEFQCETFF